MADTIPLRINWLAGQRRAHGYLVVTDDALHLVCLTDENEAVAAAGKHAGRQFGLAGALISAGVSGAREVMRAKELQSLYDAQQSLPVEQRLRQHPLSRSVTRADVVSLQTGAHLTPFLLTTIGPLEVESDAAGVHEAIASWCGRLQVPVVVVPTPKFPWKVVGAVVAAPFVLAAVYALVCVPFALMHRKAVANDLSKLAEFKRQAGSAAEAIDEPVGTSFEDACGERLARVPIERQLSWIGTLPPDAERIAGDGDFPRFTSLAPRYSRFSQPKFDLNDAAPRWTREASFTESFSHVFFSPSYWSEVSKFTGVAQVSDSSLLLAAKVQRVEVTSGQGRATLTVRAIDLSTDSTLCEGELLLDFPPDGRPSSVGLDFLMSQALPLGVFLPSCGANTDGLCKDPAYYARVAPAPEPVSAKPSKAAKATTKQTTRTPTLPALAGSGDPRDSIRAVVQRDQSAIRACYERALRRQPGLAGKVTVKFVIAPSGAVSSTTIESSTAHNDTLEQCLQGRVKGWAFPPHSKAPLAVAYPFVFSATN